MAGAVADSSYATTMAAPSNGAPGVPTTATNNVASPLLDEAMHLMIAIRGFETLDKWKDCKQEFDDTDELGVDVSRTKIPTRMVFEHNRARAAGKGFPSVLEIGRTLSLSDHEVAAIFGWTTGDYRMINPIARDNLSVVEFEDYPRLPHDASKSTFVLRREDVMPYIHVLSSALSKLPGLSMTDPLWRGHRRPISSEEMAVGSTIVLKGFTSVTRDRENALEFATKTNNDGSTSPPKRRTLLGIVESQSARCISKLSARPDEMEALFPRDVAFEVVEAVASHEDDRRAVQRAKGRLQQVIPDAEIDLVYLKEVKPTAVGGPYRRKNWRVATGRFLRFGLNVCGFTFISGCLAWPFFTAFLKKHFQKKYDWFDPVQPPPPGTGFVDSIVHGFVRALCAPVVAASVAMIATFCVLPLLMVGTSVAQGTLMTYMRRWGLEWVVQGTLDIAGIAAIVCWWFYNQPNQPDQPKP